MFLLNLFFLKKLHFFVKKTRLFNVKVVDCTTINVKGKTKRLRGKPGKTASWKKAIVKLAPGETIKVFEGA